MFGVVEEKDTHAIIPGSGVYGKCYCIWSDHGKTNMERLARVQLKEKMRVNMVLNMKSGDFDIYYEHAKVATTNLKGKNLVPMIFNAHANTIATLSMPFQEF